MQAEIVVLGTSLGGLKALEQLLSALPANLELPIVLVQHRLKAADELLSGLLQSYSKLPVIEPEDKQPLRGGHIYVAPADYHLLVGRGVLSLSTEAPVNYARPAIDVLFESAAASYRTGVVAVVLTGASADGAQGVKTVKTQGGYVIVQRPSEAESAVMPTASIDSGAVDEVLPLAQIPARLVELSTRRKRQP